MSSTSSSSTSSAAASSSSAASSLPSPAIDVLSPQRYYKLSEIDDVTSPILEPYRSMKRSHEHLMQGLFVAEGDKVVRRLLHDCRFGVDSILISRTRLDEYHNDLNVRGMMHEQEHELITVYIADKKVCEKITGFSWSQGILAVGRLPKQMPSLEDIVRNHKENKKSLLLVALDGLTNSENVGACVRSCAAFGVDAIIVGDNSCSPWLRRSIRSSMAMVFHVPIITTDDLAATLAMVSRSEDDGGFAVQTVAAHVYPENGLTLTQVNLVKDVCIVMGAEGEGIRKCVLDVCTSACAIPMCANVDSLNVAAAASVFLYEACRQRGTM